MIRTATDLSHTQIQHPVTLIVCCVRVSAIQCAEVSSIINWCVEGTSIIQKKEENMRTIGASV